MIQHDLPPSIEDWLRAVGDGGRITRLDRAVARREAWLVDIERPDGSVMEGFLRLDRTPQPGNPWSLQKDLGEAVDVGAICKRASGCGRAKEQAID